MSLLSQLVDPQILVRMDEAKFGRLEALATGTVLKEADTRKKLEASVEAMIKNLPKDPQ